MDMVLNALTAFTEQYANAWKQQQNSLPKSELYLDLPSPCVVQQMGRYVLWQAVDKEIYSDFTNVEKALDLKLHQDINSFYGTRFCADMKANWQGLAIELIQVWSDDDLNRLQENIIGHLLMQKKLKQDPSIFIATTEDDAEVICLCNQSGQIFKERLGTNQRDILALNLADFLTMLKPEVAQ